MGQTYLIPYGKIENQDKQGSLPTGLKFYYTSFINSRPTWFVQCPGTRYIKPGRSLSIIENYLSSGQTYLVLYGDSKIRSNKAG